MKISILSLVKKTTITLSLSMLVVFGGIGKTATYAMDSAESKQLNGIAHGANEEKEIKETERFLSAIESIPDEVVTQGDKQIVEWLNTHTDMEFVADNGILKIKEEKMPKQQLASITGCVGAIGIALVTTGIPFTKILKVKQALSALGGATKFAKQFYKTYKLYRGYGNSVKTATTRAINSIGKNLRADMKDALLDFFNINNVIANCT
ncbi:hypothetical protein SAMN04487866_10463 [Thermoactinomyces sp. DSM 45891]|uniref:hypothetical protein n=1 Tax=Thermoactinomyces sp. DSM 45891 TaxID=1761907 RepID=UPI000922ECA9|nr:hypothetical protein [Thermoactinomyces sp. DSM 45891]SFX31013.1 hypothetical protein SAMN04487866_10463 [Thermoactinomyces sp. DSM 45891]